MHTLVFANPSLNLTKLLPFLFWFNHSFSQFFPPKIVNPHFLLYSLIYSLRWVEVLRFPNLTYVDGSPIPSFLSGCFVGNSDNGIGTGSCLQKDIWQWYSPRQYPAAEILYPRASTILTKLKLIWRSSLLTFKTGWSRCDLRGLRLGLKARPDWGHRSMKIGSYIGS